MDYDFKKLSAVEQVSEMSDNANVLIEEDGKIKRAPKSQVGGGKYITIYATIRDTEIADGEWDHNETAESLSPEAYNIVRNAYDNDLPSNVYIVEHNIEEYSDGHVDEWTGKTLSYGVSMTEGYDTIWLEGCNYTYALLPDGTVEFD